MSIEQAIHRVWASSPPLSRLVPPERLATGLVPPRDAAARSMRLPYVSLQVDPPAEAQQFVRTSAGTLLGRISVRFHVVAEHLATAQAVAEAIHDRFQRADFAWSAGQVQDMKLATWRHEQTFEGPWHLVREYTLRYSRRR